MCLVSHHHVLETAGERSCLQIDIVQLQILQAGLDGTRHVFNRLNNLGCNVQLFARDATLFDRNPKLLLGAVSLCAVQVTVSGCYGCLKDFDGLGVKGPESVVLVPCGTSPEAELPFCQSYVVHHERADGVLYHWYLASITQFHAWNAWYHVAELRR